MSRLLQEINTNPNQATMKKYFLFILNISIVLNCYSQELKLKHKSIDNNTKESFYVLKSDKTIKQGEYLLTRDGKTSQKGFFTNNKKSGKWYYYESDGGIEFIYDFDSLKIVSDTVGIERGLLCAEGMSYFQSAVYNNIKFPNDAIIAGKSTTTITISFSVDIDGTPSDFKVKFKSDDTSLEKEALRTVKKTASELTWYPSINKKGEKVKSSISWPVHFKFM